MLVTDVGLKKGTICRMLVTGLIVFCPAHIQVSNITVGYLDFQLSHITYVPVSDLKDSIIITLVQSRVFKMKGSLFPGFYKE